jgi:hypothetical protein
VAIAWLGFFLEFTPKIQKGVLYLVSIVTNIATVTIGGTLCAILKKNVPRLNLSMKIISNQV